MIEYYKNTETGTVFVPNVSQTVIDQEVAAKRWAKLAKPPTCTIVGRKPDTRSTPPPQTEPPKEEPPKG